MDMARQSRNPRSADWQSAVSRIGNPPVFENPTFCRLAVGGYSRLATCATGMQTSHHLLKSFGFAKDTFAWSGPVFIVSISGFIEWIRLKPELQQEALKLGAGCAMVGS
jgi:hypothetical protein